MMDMFKENNMYNLPSNDGNNTNKSCHGKTFNVRKQPQINKSHIKINHKTLILNSIFIYIIYIKPGRLTRDISAGEAHGGGKKTEGSAIPGAKS